MSRLALDFFEQPTEIETYPGEDKPVSHAFKGPTPRSKIMLKKANNDILNSSRACP